MTDIKSAVAALEDARVARARLADKLRCPLYKHALFGALYGSIVAAVGGPPGLLLAVESAALLLVAVMVVLYRRELGFFVNGYRKGRTRPVVAALLLFYFAAFGSANWLKDVYKLSWPALVLGVLMFIVGTWASITWVRIYRLELDPTLGSPRAGSLGA